MRNTIVFTLNIIMLTMEISEVFDGWTTAITYTRASLLMDLIIVIKMVEQSSA